MTRIPRGCDVLVLFRDPFLVAFWDFYEPRNTMNSKGFSDFREAFWYPFRLIFGTISRLFYVKSHARGQPFLEDSLRKC